MLHPVLHVVWPQDPSGTMGAAIHSSALQQQQQLGPGCVVLVQDVSVLTPNPGSCYLAVTADNIVQVSSLWVMKATPWQNGYACGGSC